MRCRTSAHAVITVALFSRACGGQAAKIPMRVRAVVAELAQDRVSGLRNAGLLYASSGEFAAAWVPQLAGCLVRVPA